MAAKAPVLIILGAGPNIGQATAKHFASKGYKVAMASRSLKEEDSTPELFNIKSDFSKPDDVVGAFAKVRKALGIPSVVLYNGQ
jgi:NAD(P)-dependent dehydrogenase (short-subunit alcohol dehydrogenase family)